MFLFPFFVHTHPAVVRWNIWFYFDNVGSIYYLHLPKFAFGTKEEKRFFQIRFKKLAGCSKKDLNLKRKEACFCLLTVWQRFH